MYLNILLWYVIIAIEGGREGLERQQAENQAHDCQLGLSTAQIYLSMKWQGAIKVK